MFIHFIKVFANLYSFLRKKNITACVVVFSLCLLQHSATAQNNSKEYRDSIFKKFANTSAASFTTSKPYYIVSAEKALPAGISVIRQLDEKTAIIKINEEPLLNKLTKQVRIAAAADQWKLSPSLQTPVKSNKQLQFIISGLQTDELLNVLQNKKNELTVLTVDEPSRSVLVKTTAKFVRENLLGLKEIIFIDLRAEPATEVGIIGYNRSFHGLSAVDYTIPGAIGKNIVAGVKEQKMEPADLDLYKRVLTSSIAAANVTPHATVISSIIGGAGNSFYNGRGIAYGCKFFPSTFDNLFADDAAVLNINNVTVQNHSYGTIMQQFYGAEAVSYDAHAWANKNFVHLFSAGNRGTLSATDGPYANIIGNANLTGNFKMAKNIITVGAIDNRGNIPAESSAGPLYDGRVAPQLIALGPNGTSDATAVVTGTVAVMQQVYADSNNRAIPPASLTKAVLYNSADDIFRRGIDYKTGYGLLNSYASIKAIQQKEYDGGTVSQGGQWLKNISIPPAAAQLKITLAWTDTAAAVNNNKALINDLDLEVQEINSGTVYKPWVLSAAANIDSLSKEPVRKRDSLNTAEQVSIQLPAAGNYQIKVMGAAVSTSSLPFNITWHIDTLNTFTFTDPQHTSDVNRDENPDLDIRWKTFVADTNQTGNLFISYDNGANWQLLKAAHKIYTNYYRWPVKDTASRALLKMETSFGSFLSAGFVISKLSRLNVDFLCTDSVGLSWGKHIYANAYKIYALTDSPYLEQVLTVADTFTVLKRSVNPSQVYAVEPVLSNGLPAARSIAIDVTQQGVKCFYKTFYHNLQDGNRLELVLELSAPAYADSVYFQQVILGGSILITYGSGIKVTGGKNLYSQIIPEIPAGTTYWRAVIKMKGGAILYTEIINLVTSGKRRILFYPNPANRNNRLTYILQQGVSPDIRLQLFDINGRLLKDFKGLPSTIDISTLAKGLIIYKLINNDGVVQETGKLVIQ